MTADDWHSLFFIAISVIGGLLGVGWWFLGNELDDLKVGVKELEARHDKEAETLHARISINSEKHTRLVDEWNKEHGLLSGRVTTLEAKHADAHERQTDTLFRLNKLEQEAAMLEEETKDLHRRVAQFERNLRFLTTKTFKREDDDPPGE